MPLTELETLAELSAEVEQVIGSMSPEKETVAWQNKPDLPQDYNPVDDNNMGELNKVLDNEGMSKEYEKQFLEFPENPDKWLSHGQWEGDSESKEIQTIPQTEPFQAGNENSLNYDKQESGNDLKIAEQLSSGKPVLEDETGEIAHALPSTAPDKSEVDESSQYGSGDTSGSLQEAIERLIAAVEALTEKIDGGSVGGGGDDEFAGSSHSPTRRKKKDGFTEFGHGLAAFADKIQG